MSNPRWTTTFAYLTALIALASTVGCAAGSASREPVAACAAGPLDLGEAQLRRVCAGEPAACGDVAAFTDAMPAARAPRRIATLATAPSAR